MFYITSICLSRSSELDNVEYIQIVDSFSIDELCFPDSNVESRLERDSSDGETQEYLLSF